MQKEIKIDPNDFIAIHLNAAWRDRANYLLHVKLENPEGKNEWEQLWAKELDQNRYEICCIPFFAYNLALGDIVCANAQNIIKSVILPSGKVIFRVWFKTQDDSKRSEVVRSLPVDGSTFESYSEDLFGIAVDEHDSAQKLVHILWNHEQAGSIVYETGKQ